MILALNCGSSSLKFGAYRVADGHPILAYEGEAEEIGRPCSPFPDHAAALAHAFETIAKGNFEAITAVGHRIVHGGPRLREHQLLTPALAEQLRQAVPFAPLHLPAALSLIEIIRKKLPQVGQAICLDTAFHRHMPDVGRVFALPLALRGLGIERFGFHGLSLESIVAQLDPLPERLVLAHLGNGSSITAVRQGQSIDTSMGLTPTGGIMMGTRCGDLDPGVLIYLMRHGYQDAEKLEALVDHESGLLGISETTSDVRELLAKRNQDARADLALRMFAYQARKTVASMAAALGGLDALVFTGGIGEHAASLREEICSHLRFLGNFPIQVLPAKEDLQIARITAGLTKTAA